MKEFIDELKWRGMLHDVIPGTEEYLSKNKTIGYIGFDPTSDSLHIGSLVPIFILRHFQNAGHTPVVLLGGATGMIGDPSGKSDERNLIENERNRECRSIENERNLMIFSQIALARKSRILQNCIVSIRRF